MEIHGSGGGSGGGGDKCVGGGGEGGGVADGDVHGVCQACLSQNCNSPIWI